MADKFPLLYIQQVDIARKLKSELYDFALDSRMKKRSLFDRIRTGHESDRGKL
jgi:hypothetical protein